MHSNFQADLLAARTSEVKMCNLDERQLMLVFKQSGRLGNQIFQYAALKSLCREQEQLVLLGFEDLQLIFREVNAKIINLKSSKGERALYRRLYMLADYLSRKNIIGQISEYDESNRVSEYNQSGKLTGYDEAGEYQLMHKPGFF